MMDFVDMANSSGRGKGGSVICFGNIISEL
jgi:hypothetical protein